MTMGVAATDVVGPLPQTVAIVVRDATNTFAVAGIDTARLDAQVLLGFVLGTGREVIFGYPERVLTQAERSKFALLVVRRAARQPISQLVGQKEFWGRSFAVTEDVLTPRPDSETLIAAVLDQLGEKCRHQKLEILDVGTGTGCLLLTLLAECPLARGTGVDISAAALEVAKSNARELALDKRIEFIEGHWCASLPAESAFDVVVSNPPYISEQEWRGLSPEVVRYEPRAALVGGADGLEAYRLLAPQIPRVLAPQGFLVIEVGVGQARGVARILAAKGLEVQAFCPDLAGVERVIVASHRDKIGNLKK